MPKKDALADRRGGARKKAGRKPLPPEERKVALNFYVKPAQAEKIKEFVAALTRAK
ncbi:MAG: hypothetical protein IKS15_02825 [Opitutales bacterium]|nr:hypothetical protein [Opitutales bacterium]